MKTQNQAFTLVELIVVVAILAILATIGFVSYSGYLVGVRDTNRQSQLSAIHDGLEMYRTRKDLPTPENSVEVKVNGTTIANQGYMGKANLEQIEYSKEGTDPKDGTYYSYYVTKDKKYFQLMGFLEEMEGNSLGYRNALIGQTYANIDYSERFPTMIGKKLGILTDEDNTPIQEIASIQASGSIDIGTATGTYIAHLGKDDTVEGTGGTLIGIQQNASCKRILQVGGNKGDGIYTINPTGTSTGDIQVYCDMTTDGGGWIKLDNWGNINNEKYTEVSMNNINIIKSINIKEAKFFSISLQDFVWKMQNGKVTQGPNLGASVKIGNQGTNALFSISIDGSYSCDSSTKKHTWFFSYDHMAGGYSPTPTLGNDQNKNGEDWFYDQCGSGGPEIAGYFFLR